MRRAISYETRPILVPAAESTNDIATTKPLDCSVIIRHLSLIWARLAQW
jgi:hypothetical protein